MTWMEKADFVLNRQMIECHIVLWTRYVTLDIDVAKFKKVLLHGDSSTNYWNGSSMRMESLPNECKVRHSEWLEK